MIIRLYYSKKCKECMNLWQVICNEDIAKMFVLVCIDTMSSDEIIKLSVKKVPSIVVSVDNKPPGVFEGPAMCSGWLTNFTLTRRQNIANSVNEQRKMIQKTHAMARDQSGGPLDYSETEMDGTTDIYSYTNSDIAQPKNFVPIGMEHAFHIKTPDLKEGKLDNATAKRYTVEAENTLLREVEDFKRQMEQNQIKSVVGYNNGM
jgi:hypothetical protein